MKIYGLLEDLMGCGYHRIKAPLDELSKHGHMVTVSHQPPKAPHEYDILQMQKFTMPQLMPMIYALKKQGFPKMVMDLDDDLFNVQTHNPAWEFYSHPETQRNLRKSIELCHAVTVTNEYLQKVCMQYNPNVHIMPNYIPDTVLKKPKWSKFQLGWAGGFSHGSDLDSITDEVNHFLEKYNQTINIFGQDYSNKFTNSKWYTWEQYESYIARLRSHISVGIAVVDDDPFNLGKSDIKLLEYAAAGAVPIYSDKPPYLTTRVKGVSIGTTGDFPTWREALVSLWEDSMMLNMKIDSAYKSAVKLTHKANYKAREVLYESLLG